MIVFLVLLLLVTIIATIISKSLKGKKGLGFKVLEAFDFNESVKVFAYKPHVFNVFNGIKAICMLWVIFGH